MFKKKLLKKDNSKNKFYKKKREKIKEQTCKRPLPL